MYWFITAHLLHHRVPPLMPQCCSTSAVEGVDATPPHLSQSCRPPRHPSSAPLLLHPSHLPPHHSNPQPSTRAAAAHLSPRRPLPQSAAPYLQCHRTRPVPPSHPHQAPLPGPPTARSLQLAFASFVATKEPVPWWPAALE